MKYVFAVIFSIGFLFTFCFGAEKLELKDQKAKESYSLGYQFGESLKNQKMEVDIEAYTEGIRDSLGGKEPLIKQEEIRSTIMSFRQRMRAAQQLVLKEKTAKNLSEGKAFLTENGKKEGVKILSSGMQYKVLAEGSGKTPNKTDTVMVHYSGSLINGTEIDSSYKRGKPQTFRVDSVIPGWTEALQLMKEGAKWQLFIPPELAYGEKGQAPRIPSNSTLIFEIELISIK